MDNATIAEVIEQPKSAYDHLMGYITFQNDPPLFVDAGGFRTKAITYQEHSE